MVPSAQHLDVGEGAGDPALGPIGMVAADHLLEVGGGRADQRRWGQGGLAGRPVGKTMAQLHRPPVDQDQALSGIGMADRQLEDHVGAPALAGDPRAPPVLPAEVGEHGQQIAGQGGEVVAVVGLVRLPVAPLVHGGDGVAGGGEPVAPPRPRGGRSRPARGRAAPGIAGPSSDRWSGRGASTAASAIAYRAEAVAAVAVTRSGPGRPRSE